MFQTSPADGKILYYGKVENGILEQVKGVTYSLRGFLGPQTWHGAQACDINHMSDNDYQERLRLHPDNDLFHCIVYLSPGDYHRFHSPAHWNVVHRRHFPGQEEPVSLTVLATNTDIDNNQAWELSSDPLISGVF